MAKSDTLLFQRRIRYQFESFCKKVVSHERSDYLQWLQHHTAHETNFSALPDAYLAGISGQESYPGEKYVFRVCGYCVSLQNERLIDALLDICAEERSILLLYYSLGLTDQEIAQLLRTSRSRIQRLRARAFDQIQNEMRR